MESAEPEPTYMIKISLLDVQIILSHLQAGVYSNVIEIINKIYNQVVDQLPAPDPALPMTATNTDDVPTSATTKARLN